MFRIFFHFTLNVLLVSLSCAKAEAQYFYKDIWNAGQLNKEMSVLKAGKVKAVSIKSFDNDGEPSQGFFCEKRIDKNYLFAETVTKSDVTSQSLLASYFNAKGLITKTVDSTESSLNTTEYLYNNNDQVIGVSTFTKAYDDANTINETHKYIYNTTGLEKMIRTKN